MYNGQIQKWGNSKAIRLPKALLDSANLDENDNVLLEVEGDKIIIKKVDEPRTFSDLIKGFGDSYNFEEADTGSPLGGELI